MSGSTKDLVERLRKRLTASEKQLEQVASLVEKYNLKLTIRNFDKQGLLLQDQRGKTVRICHGKKEQSLIELERPNADIVIVYSNGILSGWIESSKLTDARDIMLVETESLHKMPEQFLFIQDCPHLDVFGGFTRGDYWTCARCKERLVFNDN